MLYFSCSRSFFFSIWMIIFVLFLPFASYWVLKVISVIFINKWRPIECLRYLILPKIQNKKCLKRSERDNLYIKVVDQLLTPFIKMAFLSFFLNMCYHYLEREIFLENQVNSFKKELDICRGRLNVIIFSCYIILLISLCTI